MFRGGYAEEIVPKFGVCLVLVVERVVLAY